MKFAVNTYIVCRIHSSNYSLLIVFGNMKGVSHGSAASARLVSEQMNAINPDAVIVELCEDRILSISLESKIEPVYNR